MAKLDDIITRRPTFHDTDAAYVLPNEYAIILCPIHRPPFGFYHSFNLKSLVEA